ncbi:MAG: DNA-binding transcriptional MerR regulator [Halieaceae bacterium]|jgi:DNA-binding transcriptional MerR regulator
MTNVYVNVNLVYNTNLTKRKSPMGHTHTISELAREFSITTRAIRFYEEKGLLAPEREGQHRLYSSGDRTALKLVLRGKRIGLSLEESREIIHMYNPGRDNADQLYQLKDKLDDRRSMLKTQLKDIKAMLLELENVESLCDNALQELALADAANQ